MCDYCKTLYHSNEKHDITVCPIANSLFCSCCKRRGHTTLRCPNPTSWQTRVPEFVEQLVPYELRLHHGINSDNKTPIQIPNSLPLPCHHILKEQAKIKTGDSGKPSEIPSCNTCRPVIEIPEDKASTLYTANIRATLASNNLPSTSVKENKKLLETFAAVNGKKVIYLKKDRYTVTTAPATSEVKQKQPFKIVSSKVVGAI